MTTNHSHELRYHDYRKGINHNDILAIGTNAECTDALQKIVDKDNENNKVRCGIGLYLNNLGYSIVSLEDEKTRKAELAAPELLSSLQNLLSDVLALVDNSKYVQLGTMGLIHIVQAKEAIKKATS